MTYALGIDVGTTFTAAAVWQDGRSTVLPLGRRSDAIPTVVAVRDNGDLLIGDAAERRGLTDPAKVSRAFKRRIADPVPIHLGDHRFTAASLIGAVARWVVDQSTERMGAPPAAVVLTHPAEWRQHRIELLRTAARDAGLPPIALAVEPVAAATYYAMRTLMLDGSIVGVYDLGGGTFDACLVEKTPHGFSVYGRPDGNDGLGGLDVDERIWRHVTDALADTWQHLDSADPDTTAALAGLRQQVTLAKEALSDDVDVSIPVVLPGLIRQVRLTRSELEDLSRDIIDDTVSTFARLLARSDLTADRIQAVLLVGGTSRMPLVAERLTFTLRLPVAVDEHPKYAVCLGAATLAGAELAGTERTSTAGESADVDARKQRSVIPDHQVKVESPASPPLPRLATGGRPTLSLIADLTRTGLAGNTTGRVLPLPPARRPMPSPRAEPLVVRTTSRPRAVSTVVVLLAALAVLGIALFLLISLTRT